ncbi:DNA repair exonuclease [Pseudovirgaria hyperparasitica]|uniref:Double-strand break repair protein n=1 Tax=Pseudovirgaria hyperparasitica TaxID=470096 RepID=A0A6A6WI47_9PEZI|nr:DNA repair exonuclease [Pseudovirgaria hyperparasitica]KAF2761909.1 DNA repair exonuclease [Pseudovirgaria hyperparasitica]
MPPPIDADTIRILVATDNHVGYNERDPIRGSDSWRSFDEIMCLAKERDVDMVLLAGDLFHENKPSRKAMYEVMRSLRMNCFGEKPCEVEMLSDASENFQGEFNHVNYEDPDINVAIPVFSIHGNHDDPSGENHLAALDILQMSGLLNYYGRTPESDNIAIKPVLLQKGRTKLALYGMSNVRDERLFRTFRDGKVKFFQPSTAKDEWFNLMSVHQNHAAHTETSYLPENFLPEFMDLVIWGHEHQCLIDPRYNPEMSFHVMQPGSSVATSLSPGETDTKHIAILSVTGKQFKSEPIQLKSVRPFIMKDVVLQNERALRDVWRQDDNRTKVTQHLIGIVDKMIAQAKTEWNEAQNDPSVEAPLPLIRLRVEYTAPEGGKFDCENPQRFSNRFVGKVANVNDVVQFHRKKTASRKARDAPELPEEHIMDQLALDSVKVEKLVREFLTAQSLTILPQNTFGDAVSQFVDKDDRHAMEIFVNSSLASQVKHLLDKDDIDETEINDAMESYRVQLEEMFATGQVRANKGKRKYKPKPPNWDSDMDGDWEEQPGALIISDRESGNGDEDDDEERRAATTRGRARGRAGKALGTGTTRKTITAKRNSAKAPAKAAPARGKKKIVQEESEEEDDDVIMIDDDDENDDDGDESQGLFVSSKTTTARRPPSKALGSARAKSPVKKPTARAAATASARQTKLDFSQSAVRSQKMQANTRGRAVEPSDDEISDDDDDDAFEPAPPVTRNSRR